MARKKYVKKKVERAKNVVYKSQHTQYIPYQDLVLLSQNKQNRG